MCCEQNETVSKYIRGKREKNMERDKPPPCGRKPSSPDLEPGRLNPRRDGEETLLAQFGKNWNGSYLQCVGER